MIWLILILLLLAALLGVLATVIKVTAIIVLSGSRSVFSVSR